MYIEKILTKTRKARIHPIFTQGKERFAALLACSTVSRRSGAWL